MEKQIKPGVFISVVTRENWLKRTAVLKGEDRQFFIAKCNPASLAQDHTELPKKELFRACREMEPNFNPNEDYYVIRYAPQVEARVR